MYGTVARIRLKPGMAARFLEQLHAEEKVKIPGAICWYVYQLDADPDEYYLAVMFESRAAYLANADSPEQDARYRQLRAFMAGDPEWHDGEIVSASVLREA